MTWQMVGLVIIRVVMAMVVYFVAWHFTKYKDIDDRIFWMFAIGYIAGRIWSMIGQ